ncbi:TetR/AcrR family transcriptional regulator [Celeribacter litoreus]|uniref:TetR/AcrR family transcriptional regulator n=1 Tax=Celeribacter litoreus TaxID=2876714 RepID=UPI001CC9CEE0|nr:TetR/AcrR family transcriptional regulator [Celeribacter litoreus]MCA0044843.1 TetR/AcrR family transcriptional regulator [Celeribacter litoreus]
MSERATLTARGLARQEALIETATDLFLGKGFDAVSVDEIVAAAGGSKTNIYRQFGNKTGLFTAVVERMSQEFLSPLDQLVLGPVDLEIGLQILGRTLLGQLLTPKHIAFQRMVIASSVQFPDLMTHWYEVGPRRSQSIFRSQIEKSSGAPELAVLFHDMLVTEPVTRAMMGRPMAAEDVEAHIQSAVRLVISGV